MIKIKFRRIQIAEINYIVDYLFSNILGLEYSSSIEADNYEITLSNNSKLIIESHFWKTNNESTCLKIDNIPKKIHRIANQFIVNQDIPVIYGNDKLQVSKDMIICGIDIFASSFFMLTRWEEIVNTARDYHGRFPVEESLGYKHGFLDRPVVNEYIEMLWNMLKYLDPSLKRKKRKFRTIVSHDVDHPFNYLYKSIKKPIIDSFVAIKKTKNPIILASNLYRWIKVNTGSLQYDPFYTYDFILYEEEKRGFNSAFYFLPSGSKDIGTQYTTDTVHMQALLKNIYDSGAEIGIHGHYETYMDQDSFLSDVSKLQADLVEVGINSTIHGGRQHFLRWSTPETMRNYEAAGLKYDTSLSYAEHAGFRCGICYEYPFFDVDQRRVLNIVERPLIAMEASIILPKYMGKGRGKEALEVFRDLKNKCRKYDGDFTLLWHNSFLTTLQDKELYLKVLDL